MFGRKAAGKAAEIKSMKEKPVVIDYGDMKVSCKLGNAQHIGKRSTQEDYFGFSDVANPKKLSSRGLCAVLADGMGGLSSGRQISEYAVTNALLRLDSLDSRLSISSQLEAVLNAINGEVCKEFSSDGETRGGSTLVVAVIFRDKLFWACTGDSRIYLLRNDYLYQLNQDHNYKNRLLKEYIDGTGALSDAFDHPQKDALTSFIGVPGDLTVDTNRIGLSLQKGDKVMLCSDGVYHALPEFGLIKRLSNEEPQRASEKIAMDILENNDSFQDNLTVMVIGLD